MLRVAFIMQVNPGDHEEYIRRHNPIWPELQQVLRDHGVQTYSIFLDRRTSQLFAYAEVRSRADWDSIANTEVCQRWWRSMSPLMPSDPDHSPIAFECEEVFHFG